LFAIEFLFFYIVLKDLNTVGIVQVQSVLSADPDKGFAILKNGSDLPA
jgi:aminoglycoside/choline kinase family phosphotransferase